MKKVYTDYIGNGNCCYFPELVKTNRAKILKKFFVLVFAGLFIGAVNGFFGGGGGMLVVPALTVILSLEEKKAPFPL